MKVLARLNRENPFFLGPLLLFFAVFAALVLIRHPGITGLQVLDESSSAENGSISPPVDVLVPPPEPPEENLSADEALDFPLPESPEENLSADQESPPPADNPVNDSIYVNETDAQVNDTIPAAEAVFEEQLVQGVARVGVPVVWTKRIVVEQLGEVVIKTDVPGSASNVEVFEQGLPAGGGAEIASSGRTHLSGDKFSIGNAALQEAADITIADVIDSPKVYEIVYETPAPVKSESVISPTSKMIVISSDTHYENVIAAADLGGEYPKEVIRLYWLKDDSKEEVTPTDYVDSDSDSLIESIEWVVPSLSEETYEVSIEILNVHSYPAVGEEWTVMFNTTGTADLTITPSDGTTFTEFLADDAGTTDDLEFLDLRCGEESLKQSLELIDENGIHHSYSTLAESDSLKISSLFVPDYTCDNTAYLTNRERDAGRHLLLFQFGDQAATAENDACVNPTDDYDVTQDTTFCAGTFYLDDVNNDGLIRIGPKSTCSGTVANTVPVSATNSSWYSSSYPPSNTLDNNLATNWYSASKTAPQWLRFDLGSMKCVSGINVSVSSAYSPENLTIYVSNDDSAWTLLVGNWQETSEGSWNWTSFTETQARYIRVNFTQGAGALYYGMQEFRALARSITSGNNFGVRGNGTVIVGDNAGYGIYSNGTSILNISSMTVANYSYDVYVFNSNSVALRNMTVANSTYGVYLNNSNTTNVTNSTFVNNNYGVYTRNSATNLFFYNNFTGSTLYHAFADTSGNYFNTTNGSSCGAKCARGNYWDDVLSLDIYDTNADGYGDAGTQYPYSSACSSKVNANVTDYGPKTGKVCYDADGDGAYNTSSDADCTGYRDCDDTNANVLPPRDNLNVTGSVVLCNGTYYLNDSGAEGILSLRSGSASVRCNQTVIIGNSSGVGLSVLGDSVVRDCDLRNYSRGVSVAEGVGWNRSFSWGTGTDIAYGVAVDSAGNIVSVGEWYNGANSDWRVLKLDGDGDVLWNRSYNWVGNNEKAYDVAVDSGDNVIVVGNSSNASRYNWRILKLDSDGNALWNRSYNWSSFNSEYAYGVAVDSDDNLVVVGCHYALWTGTWTNAWRVLKLDSNGNELWNWSYNWAGLLDDCAHDVAIDSDNNILVVGDEDITFYGYAWRVLKLDSDGVALWNKSLRWSSSDDIAYGIAVDSGDNAVVVGHWDNGGASDDWRILKLDSSGNELWNRSYAWAGQDIAYGVSIDPADNVFVAGLAYSATQASDWGVMKLDSAGTQLWNRTFSSPGSLHDRARAIALNAGGNPVIAGDWGNSSPSPHWDWLLLALGSDGNNTLHTALRLNSTLIGSSGTGVLLRQGSFGTLFNSTINSSTGCGLSINDTDSYTVRNTTFSSNYYGVCLDASSTANLFYYNNFTNNSLYHAFADAAGNFFNTTNGSSCGALCARGNYWDDILSLDIYDSNGDGFGDSGTQYPYNSTFSSKVNVNVTDYGPITSKSCTDADGDGFYTTASDPICSADYRDCDDSNASIMPPKDDMNITSSIVLCSGTYYLNDSGSRGVLRLVSSNASVRCNQTVIIGNTSGVGASVLTSSSMRDCDFRNYSVGVGVDGSNFWYRSFSWSTSTDTANDVVVDSGNNALVAGAWTNASQEDWRVLKLNSTGSTLWDRSFNWSNYDELYETAVDSAGSSVIVGEWQNTTPAGHLDWRVLKLDSNGNTLWSKSFSWSTDDDQAFGVAVGADNNITVVGKYYNSTYTDDWRILKLDSSGNTLWNKVFNWSTGQDFADAVAIDSDNNNIVAGSWRKAVGDDDWRVLKLDSSGNALWNRTYNWSDIDDVDAVAVDSANNIVVVGTWYNSSPASHFDWRVLKLDSSGNQLWNKSISWGASDDVAYNTFFDSSGNIIVGGYWTDPSTLAAISLIVKLDSNGNVLWNRSYYFGASSSITGLNKDSDGNIYSAGAWLNTSHFDWFVMKTDSEGYYTTSLALNSTFVMNSATAILLQKSASGSIFNSSVNSSAGCGLSINDTDSYTVRNTTFSSNYYGVCIDASSTANLFYYNNFTNNSLYHAFADAAGNFFNTTNGSSCGANCSRGNYWDGILSLKIYDTNSDGFGDYGPQYPYNSTNGGNVSSNINDWGPITNRTDYVIQPPVLFQPSDGAIITDSRNPLYGWHNPAHTLSDDVTYQIQVDDDPGFSSPAVDVADIAETTTDTYYWSSSSLDFSVDYFWHVRANDTYYVSEWSSVFNFSILPTVSCAQPVDEIEFGQMCIFANQTRCDNEGLGSHINDTLDNHPPPYLLENNGNLRSRGEIYSTSLWTSPTYRQMPSKYYQFMIGVDEASSYDWALDSAWVNMTNVSASAPESYYGWKWENVSDSFKLHIRLEVPTDEPAGVKYSTTYVTCEQNETY